jgi:hypothetical protein
MSAATDKGVRLRTARKDGRCANATAHIAGNAPGCERLILAGDRYMEGDRNETAGGFGFDRICMGCYSRDYAPKASTEHGVLAVMSDAACDFQHEHGDFANSEKMRLAHATVAELIEAGERASALIKAQGDLIEEYRTSGKCPHAVASQAVNLMHERNGLVTTGAINNSAKFDAALARCNGGAK